MRGTVVGRDVTPEVGLEVREILGGLRPGRAEDGIEAGDRRGVITRVIGRVAAQSQTSTTLSCGVVWEEGGEMQASAPLPPAPPPPPPAPRSGSASRLAL